MTARLLFVGLALLGVSCGRADGPARYAVSGVVTYAGEPVPVGEMRFEPDPERGGTGPGGYARIQNGKFTTDRDWGAVGGPHVVRILAGTGRNASPIDPFGDPLFRGEYRTTLDLPHGPMTCDIDIPRR